MELFKLTKSLRLVSMLEVDDVILLLLEEEEEPEDGVRETSIGSGSVMRITLSVIWRRRPGEEQQERGVRASISLLKNIPLKKKKKNFCFSSFLYFCCGSN